MIDVRSGNAVHPRSRVTAAWVACGGSTLTAQRAVSAEEASGEVGQDAQMPTAGAAAVVRRVARGLRAGGLAHGVRQREQIVTGRAGVVDVDLVPDDLPAARHRQPLRVELAQVVAVRLRVR